MIIRGAFDADAGNLSRNAGPGRDSRLARLAARFEPARRRVDRLGGDDREALEAALGEEASAADGLIAAIRAGSPGGGDPGRFHAGVLPDGRLVVAPPDMMDFEVAGRVELVLAIPPGCQALIGADAAPRSS